MDVPRQKEDLTTERLAGLLRTDGSILRLFLRFLFADTARADELARLPLCVETQHAIPNGRFDLLIHHRSTAVIVECKVNDGQRVYQLQKYHAHWQGMHQAKPHLFWLVRRNTESLGLNPYLEAERRWHELRDFLRWQESGLSAGARAATGEFCRYLEAAEVALIAGENTVRRRRDRGYEYGEAERLLAAVAGPFKDSVFEVTPPMNKVTHRLFIGRRAWAAKFEDGWAQRVVLQFKPEVGGTGFFWHGNIMLYNRHDVPDPTFAIAELPRWAPICKKAGFRLLRNLDGNWNGKYSYELEAPYFISRPVKYFHAPLPDITWPKLVFAPGDERAAIAEGVRMVQYMYQVVDQF